MHRAADCLERRPGDHAEERRGRNCLSLCLLPVDGSAYAFCGKNVHHNSPVNVWRREARRERRTPRYLAALAQREAETQPGLSPGSERPGEDRGQLADLAWRVAFTRCVSIDRDTYLPSDVLFAVDCVFLFFL